MLKKILDPLKESIAGAQKTRANDAELKKLDQIIKKMLGKGSLRKPGMQVEYTEEHAREVALCKADYDYFVRKYVTIIDVDVGLVKFDMYPYQAKTLRAFVENRFIILKFPRQSGKSTTFVAYLLWMVLFNAQWRAAIVANKAKSARGLLARIRMAYERIPLWMQQGVVGWNKSTLELENGSKIIADATSSSGLRSDTYNCVVMDEFAHVQPGLAEEFMESTFPIISSGQTTQIIIVSTPKGMNQFYKLWNEAEPNHVPHNGFVQIEVAWHETPGRDDAWKRAEIARFGERYFDQEYGCLFLGSTNTLISAKKLRVMTYKTPIATTEDGLKIYKHPEPGHTYFMCVDLSHGKGMDYHCAQIVDVTDFPYEQVATFRSDDMSPNLMPDLMHRLGNQYNGAWVLAETNDGGQRVIEDLLNELEYEWVVFTGSRSKSIYAADFLKSPQIGLYQTKATKRLGCSNLKDLIETDRLLINDYATIEEMKTFVQEKMSWAADKGTGAHDDTVMALVTFAWMARQDYFMSMTGKDFRAKMSEENQRRMEDQMVGAGFVTRSGGIPGEEELKRAAEASRGPVAPPDDGKLYHVVKGKDENGKTRNSEVWEVLGEENENVGVGYWG